MKMTKNAVRYVISVILLMVCIMMTLSFDHYRNRNRNFEQVDQYIDELSKNTAKHVSDVFADKRAAIESVAYLYGDAIETTEADLTLLAGLEESSGFDWIRFVASDGTDYASDGSTTNVRDREYFARGMSGESGICEVLESRINGEKLIGFYAPVYFHDGICGLTVGFLTESTISDILDTNLYDYPANTYIFREDGTALGKYMADSDGAFHISHANEMMECVNKEYREAVSAAIRSQERCRFLFTGDREQSVGYVVPITGTSWSLMQMFPSEATHIIMTSTHRDSVRIFSIITGIFALFFVFLFITYHKDEKARSEELARNKVNLLMRSVSEDYLCLIDVNLETEKEVKYILSSEAEFDSPIDLNCHDYPRCAADFAGAYIAEYDRERFLHATSLPVLRETLSRQNDFYIEYDAVAAGKTLRFQSKFTISDSKQFEDHMLVSIRDITEITKERNAKEKELSEAKIMAESANNAKTAFLFNMSHDIRTPINAIIGFTDLLEKHIGDEEKIHGYIKKIKYSSDFLLALINNVLEMARIESGKMVLEETLWSIEQLNDTILSVFEEQFRQKDLRFTKEIDITHRYLICDALKLKQVYLNLLSNAVKYTPEGGSISMVLRELPYDREGYGLYRCTVTDTGIGMSEEFQKHVFEQFTRESTATESRIVGSGLGMTIVKKLVDLMGGTIEVESRVGEGTTFTLTIPHKLADQSTVDKMRDTAREYTDVVFEQRRVLLAEDNDMNAEIAEEILGGIGLVTERATDGVVCVDMMRNAEEGYYDMVLMDIQMPRMNGYDATREIRRLDGKKAAIPIVAMTANAFEEDRKNAYDAGMDGHISKPIEMPKLMEMLARFFQPKRKAP